MSMMLNSILLILFMLASALFSGLETGGYLLNRLTLRCRARQRDPRALCLQKILGDAHLFIFTVLIGNNIAIYLLSRHVTNLYMNSSLFSDDPSPFWSAETAATLTLMMPLFIFAELLPKNLFRINADTLMYQFSRLLSLFQWIFYPVSLMLKTIFHLLTAGRIKADALGGFSLSVEGLREYFSEKSVGKVITSYQHGMIDNLVSMKHIPVSRIMKPCSSVVSVSGRTSVRNVLQLMSERNVDQVLVSNRGGGRFDGVAHLDDLMQNHVEQSMQIKAFCRNVERIASRRSIPEAFQRLMASPDQCTLVMDRSGRRVAGIIRFCDIAGFIASKR